MQRRSHILQCAVRSSPEDREGGREVGLEGEEMEANMLFTVEWGPVGG